MRLTVSTWAGALFSIFLNPALVSTARVARPVFGIGRRRTQPRSSSLVTTWDRRGRDPLVTSAQLAHPTDQSGT